MDWSPVLISLATSLTATAVTLLAGLAAAAWRQNRAGAGAALVDGIFILPLVLPPTVVGFLLLLLFGRNGPLGKLLLQFGASVVFAWPATVIAATVVAFPLMYITARAALEQVDPHLLQAARTLGASEARIFREVALPLAWPGVLAGTILSFARALGEFGAPWPGAPWTWASQSRCSAGFTTGRTRNASAANAGDNTDVTLEVQIEKKLAG